MSDTTTRCLHVHFEYGQEFNSDGAVVKELWRCRDCGMRFVPTPSAPSDLMLFGRPTVVLMPEQREVEE